MNLPWSKPAEPASPASKLGVLVASVDQLFAVVAGEGGGEDTMTGILGPVLKQAMSIMARRADELPEAQRQQIEKQLGLLLRRLADGLDDDAVSIEDYATRFAA